MRRWQKLHRRPIVAEWGLKQGRSRDASPRSTRCWHVATANVSIAFTRAKFGRVRSDLKIPDIDRATSFEAISIRPWMEALLVLPRPRL